MVTCIWPGGRALPPLIDLEKVHVSWVWQRVHARTSLGGLATSHLLLSLRMCLKMSDCSPSSRT